MHVTPSDQTFSFARLESFYFVSIAYLHLKPTAYYFECLRLYVGLTLRLLMSYIYIYIYGAPILDVSRSHTMMQHSR